MKRFPLSSLAIAAAVASGIAGAGLLRAEAKAQPSQGGPFLVFFDWGKPELGGDTKATLDKVAEVYAAAPGSRLRIEGHTDRSGSAAVNLTSARRRAAEVRDYLVSKGVPRGAVSIVSHGERRPLIPTEDGVREVQNRRVEIFLEPATAR